MKIFLMSGLVVYNMSEDDINFEKKINDLTNNIHKLSIIHLMKKDPELTLAEATKLHAKNMEKLDKA